MADKEIFMELGIGTRMRRLYEMMSTDADRLYVEANIPFKVSYFYVVYALSVRGDMPISEIAKLAGFSHSAVSQIVKKLTTEGIVKTKATSDGRQKLVTLSQNGQKLLQDIQPYWLALEASMKEAIEEAGVSMIDAIASLEKAFSRTSLYKRAKEKLSNQTKPDANFKIVPYDAKYKQAFYDYNVAWLKEFFEVEPIDEKVLSDPEQYILSTGGEIFFAVENGRAIGTVAMKTAENGAFELTKLAVDPSARKGGIGAALCEVVIERFQARGGKTLYLETNTKLENAIRLYWKLDFVELPSPFKSPYERANYYMEWQPGIKEV